VHKGPPYGQGRRKKRTLETVRRAAIESRKGPIETIMTAAGKEPRGRQDRPEKKDLETVRNTAGSGAPQEKTL
jgi:hypothetical protein